MNHQLFFSRLFIVFSFVLLFNNGFSQSTHNPPQNVCIGAVEPYRVDTTGPNTNSNYTWGVTGTGFVGIISNNGTNAISIDWGATPVGNYDLYVVEDSANGCTGDTSKLAIIIVPNSTVSAASSTPTLCINTVLTAITHTTTGATGIGAATGLPAGVTAAWSGGTITISGTPTADGVFNYSIPLTGGCGTVNATGTITVEPANTVSAASSTPTLCINTVLTAITHTTTGATGIGAATGLPAGVTAAWSGGTITISGTPTADGVFNYSIPLTGGCGTVNATGTITVNPAPVTPSLASNSPVCIGGDGIFTVTGTATDVVTYSINSGAPTTATIGAGGTVDITLIGINTNQSISLTQVSDGSCSLLTNVNATITVVPRPTTSNIFHN